VYTITHEGDLYTKMFSTLSGVRLLSCILSPLSIICASPAKRCDSTNNDPPFTMICRITATQRGRGGPKWSWRPICWRSFFSHYPFNIIHSLIKPNNNTISCCKSPVYQCSIIKLVAIQPLGPMENFMVAFLGFNPNNPPPLGPTATCRISSKHGVIHISRRSVLYQK